MHVGHTGVSAGIHTRCCALTYSDESATVNSLVTEWLVVLLLVVVTLLPLRDVTYMGDASFKKLKSCDVAPFCWFS